MSNPRNTLWQPSLGLIVPTALAVLIGGLYLLVHLIRPPALRLHQAWFIDEKDGKTALNPADAFAAGADNIPPLLNKEEKPAIVRAIFVFHGNYHQRQLAYLEKYTPRGQDAFDQIRQHVTDLSPWFLFTTQNGHLIRLPAPGSPWVPVGSPEAIKVFTRVYEGAKPLTYCPPS